MKVPSLTNGPWQAVKWVGAQPIHMDVIIYSFGLEHFKWRRIATVGPWLIHPANQSCPEGKSARKTNGCDSCRAGLHDGYITIRVCDMDALHGMDALHELTGNTWSVTWQWNAVQKVKILMMCNHVDGFTVFWWLIESVTAGDTSDPYTCMLAANPPLTKHEMRKWKKASRHVTSLDTKHNVCWNWKSETEYRNYI